MIRSCLCSSSSVTSLCLLLCVLWTLCWGQTCYSTGPDEDSSCSTSDSCRAEHGGDEDAECRGPHPTPYPPQQLPHYIKQCNYTIPMFGVPAPCQSTFVPLNASAILDNPIRVVNATFYSIDWRSFAVNVSWDHHNNPTEGYQLRAMAGHYPYSSNMECLCIYNPNSSSIEVLNRHYGLGRDGFTIKLSLIHSPKLNTLSTVITRSFNWPRTCLDISHTDSTCALPVYEPPTNVTVHTEYTPSTNQTLHIQWSYQTESTLPATYYVEVYDHRDLSNFHTFIANNTDSVAISQLNNAVTYLVRIIPYVRCSGLANRTYALGCGTPSTPTLPLSPTTNATTLTPSTADALATSPLTHTTALTRRLEFITAISTVGGLCVLLISALFLVVGVLYKIRWQERKLELNSPQPECSEPEYSNGIPSKETRATGAALVETKV